MSGRRRSNRRGPRGKAVRVTRTSGSGSNRTTSHSTGGLSISGMSPTGRIADPRPTIRATVRDQGTSLSKRDVALYVDGSRKSRFHYDEASGRLSYYVGNALTPGTHEVRIEATSAAPSEGKTRFSGASSKRWTFTVARR